SAAQTLLAGGVDAVVAGVTTPVAARLTGVFADAGVPLFVANVGGHLVRPSDRSPGVLHLSLGYWQASYALGRWAATNVGACAVDESLLRKLGSSAVGARSAFSWSPTLSTQANRSFKRAYRLRAGRAPDAFAVLGYDAASVIAAGVSRSGSASGMIPALDGA